MMKLTAQLRLDYNEVILVCIQLFLYSYPSSQLYCPVVSESKHLHQPTKQRKSSQQKIPRQTNKQ